MDVTSVLEALKDFEKRGKSETIPLLEQFLCHVAKTGEPLLSWTEIKPYFMFKLESIMDSFHASAPEQRLTDNPNVEHVTFEEMKNRILKIVDGYNGIPFTIQRLCELLADPKRNYSGTGKFLRGLEKNVMVVSCLFTTSEKNGSVQANIMNGVMFQGDSQYSESRNINGPSSTKLLNRSRLILASSFSSNGLPEVQESKLAPGKPEEEISDTALSEEEVSPNVRTKNKHEEEREDEEGEGPEVKRLKCETEEKGLERLSEPLQSNTEEDHTGARGETPAISGNQDESCENQSVSSEGKNSKTEIVEAAEDRQEANTPSETNTDSEEATAQTSDSGDGEEPDSSDLTNSDVDSSDLRTEYKPEEQD